MSATSEMSQRSEEVVPLILAGTCGSYWRFKCWHTPSASVILSFITVTTMREDQSTKNGIFFFFLPKGTWTCLRT